MLKWFSVGAVFLLGLLACSNERVAMPPLELVKHDLKALAEEKFAGVPYMAPELRQRFADLFGGTSNADVRRYFSENISHIVYPGSYDYFPKSQIYISWTRMPVSRPGSLPYTSNIGTAMWIQGLLDNTPRFISVDGSTFAINSHSSNIIQVSDQYTEFSYLEDGREIDFPASYRLAALAHEGRHSQCTGGISESVLQGMRTANSYPEFLARFPDFECGHFHSICDDEVKGMAGAPACDPRPFAAYSVSWIYAEATAVDPTKSERERHMMKMVALDSKRRIRKADVQIMLADHKIKPDMSGQGVIFR